MAIRTSPDSVADVTKDIRRTTSPNNRETGRRTNRAGFIAIVLAALAIVLVACGGGSGGSVQKLPSVSAGSEVKMDGDKAPNFAFTLFQGEDKLGAGISNLHDLQGQPVVLNFWAGLCPPCRAEMPDLQEFYDEFSDRVTLIGIDLGQFTGLGTRQDAVELLEELEVTYPAGYTDDSGVIKDYRILGMPTTIFIDANGEVFKNWGGALNADVLRDQSLQMLNK